MKLYKKNIFQTPKSLEIYFFKQPYAFLFLILLSNSNKKINENINGVDILRNSAMSNFLSLKVFNALEFVKKTMTQR